MSRSPHARPRLRLRIALGAASLLLPAISVVGGAPGTVSASASTGRDVITVTGGTVSESGGFRSHRFDFIPGGEDADRAVSTLVISGGTLSVAEVLVVGGGGGGGISAGGGAGGLLYETLALTAGTYAATVGRGGPGGWGPMLAASTRGESGVGSRFEGPGSLDLFALGGGGGGGNSYSENFGDGLTGGSGGGGGSADAPTDPGLGTDGQGFAGGANETASPFRGGGGGGSGGVGTAGSSGGAGGAGTVHFGSTWAKGGNAVAFIGGSAEAAGTPGSGDGGSGGPFGGSAANGSSGVVIVRYPIPVWHQDADLGAIRIGDPLDVGALVGDPAVDATFELVSGSLPSGLSIAGSADALTGTASTAGTYTFTLRAFDRSSGAGVAVDRTFTVEVFDALIVDEPFNDAPGPGWVLNGQGTFDDSPWTPRIAQGAVGGTDRGALRLTEDANSLGAFVVYDIPQQTRAGLDVSFTIAMWRLGTDINPADGLTFFLKRGDDDDSTPGPFGANLAYLATSSSDGLSGALLGVGFDAEGNFPRSNRDQPAGDFTCPAGVSTIVNKRDNLSVRGPGQDKEGYCVLAVKENLQWTDRLADGKRSRDAAKRDVRVRYDYVDDGEAPSGRIRIWIDDLEISDTPALDFSAPQELLDSETFKFGFSASTGGRRNTHEVWDVVVRSVEPLAPVTWTGEALDDGIVGEAYTAALDAKAQGGVRPYTFSLAGGQLPPGMTLNSPLAGTPTQPGTYTFDVTATSSRGGTAATESFTLLVKDQQTLELTVPSQPLDVGSLTLAPVSRAQTSGSATDLPVAVASTSPSTCTASGTTVTFVAAGSCDLTATQAGGTSGGLTYAAASPLATSFQIIDVDLGLAGLSLSSAALSPSFSTSTTTYQASVPNGVTSVGVTPMASDATATITVQGQSILSGASSSPIPLSVGSNTIEVTVQNGAFERTTTITVQRAGPAAPPAAEVAAPPLPPGPVLTAGSAPRPSPTPTARVGDREVTVVPTPAGTVRREGTTTVSTATILEVGGVSLAVDVTGAGEVRTAAGAAPQISVARDSVARTSGGGMLPGTQLQVWLPLAGGSTVRPVTSLPVAADGTFTGELPFDGRSDRESDGRPLPIGTHVLQLVGVDAQGEVTVIEQTVRIEQPAPSPEPDRRAGAPPTLSPGASIATNAGVPEAVTIVPVPEVRQARVEGTGWTMAVDIPSADGRVAPAEGGGALIELVEEDFAEVSGDGFLPGTRADVWLFSTPTLLGTVTIGPDGSFSGLVPVTGIATGEHTLQLQGVGRDGYVRAANLGVAVVPRPVDEPAPEPEPELEVTPVPAPERPADSVEVITATGPEPSGGSPLVWIALLAAVLGSSGWWFLIGRRRRDDEDKAHQG